MIKLTKLEKHSIRRTANPTHTVMADLYIPNFHGDTRQAIAEYVIDTYDLGVLNSVKNSTTRHVLDFTAISGNQITRTTGKIEYID
ncbi:hypothetical protein FE407_01900 [Leuconostoc carnosum]|uniref:Uncharacterized protein n=2 Tax=Leuconostoc carnosum TaxID=1252 RepID=K0DBK8_LEUCJ|nr:MULTISPECIES: hypothetical protein [Leuconostoc]AFT81301.1 hypothetical protein C270_01920 [Leuconostoc carnosum JB16]KAA8326633.1 hypothetical protein FE404_01900 [Leuconostoc carnosum]KAA8330120.1 hypothetical protein FE409_01940 [Leuconostoc carnosum]KAA8362194.1 hypothetical protein FE407_01900 [Leuconostoc carnosum]KAA8366743.1 hypothetical protein FE406_01900 [Leuconostoc carnosum]